MSVLSVISCVIVFSPVADAVTIVVGGLSLGKVGIADRLPEFSSEISERTRFAYSSGIAPSFERLMLILPVNVTVSPELDAELFKLSKNKSLHEEIESKVKIDTTAQKVIRKNLHTFLHINVL